MLSTLEARVGQPIQGKTIYQRWVTDRGTNFYESAFKVFITQLEEGEQTSSKNTIIEAHNCQPEGLNLKKIKEYL